ncbi:NSA1, partial [Symbiodinium pilosum]
VVWTARNVREDSLCLRVPVKVSTLGWATTMCPARSLITCGTSDGKIRVYDANAQRRPLFELQVGYKVGAGAGGWTGVSDDTK